MQKDNQILANEIITLLAICIFPWHAAVPWKEGKIRLFSGEIGVQQLNHLGDESTYHKSTAAVQLKCR
jgi:hypothetical protein